MRKRSKWFGLGLLLAGLLVAAVGGLASASNDEVRIKVVMTGAQEVPSADPDGSAKAEVTINVGAGQICFDIRTDSTGTPSRGHIHFAPAGTNGGIVVPFFELAAVPTDPRHDELENGRIEGCVAADPAVLQAIVANPSLYYVNLHNARFPGGAVRGQLE